MMECEERTWAGQPSWVIRAEGIEVFLAQHGGMMGPVFFSDQEKKKTVQPYYISPWQEEGLKIEEPVMQSLRGDFFCMPFGADNSYQGETHSVHGETAGRKWDFEAITRVGKSTRFKASLKTKERPGVVTKEIVLNDNQSAVYITHTLEGFSGQMSLGHHATLRADHLGPGDMKISTSPVHFGIGRPAFPSYTLDGEYMSAQGDHKFYAADHVPSIWKDPEYVDFSEFPQRSGYSDIIGFVSLDALTERVVEVPAWTAAVVSTHRYLWFSLKNPKLLPLLVVWTDNKGRHSSPWDGRNVCIGLEDVCGYLAEGLAPSAAENPISLEGIPTVHELSPGTNLTVPYIEGTVMIPGDFSKVERVVFESGRITFIDDNGKQVSTLVDWEFVLQNS